MEICVFGDSIAWGAFDSEHGGWVELLKNDLMNEHHYLYNCAISSDNSSKLLKRIKDELKSRQPNIIIVAIGINDSYFWNKKFVNSIEIKVFDKNIKKIIKIAKKQTDKVVFVGLTKVNEKLTNPITWNEKDVSYFNKDIEMYNMTIKGFCMVNKLPFISLLEALNPQTDLADGLHPNSQGHEKIYNKVKQELDAQKIFS